jgi:hypothetical protein
LDDLNFFKKKKKIKFFKKKGKEKRRKKKKDQHSYVECACGSTLLFSLIYSLNEGLAASQGWS